MARIDPHRLVIRRLQSEDMPAVTERICTALAHVRPAREGPRTLLPGEFDLAAIADYVWVLWRDEAPVALLHVYVTHRLGTGFERITWLCEQEPEWAMQACLSLGLRKAFRQTIDQLALKTHSSGPKPNNPTE